MTFSILCLFTLRNFMPQAIVFPAANAPTCVPLAISALKMESLSGEIHVPTAWLVSAIAQKKRLNMGSIAKA